MNKIVKFFMIIALVILTAMSFYNYTSREELLNIFINYKNEIEIKNRIDFDKYKQTSYLFNQSILNSNIVLNNITVIDEDGISLKLKEIFDNNPKLVLKYSDINCMTCVDSCLIYLNKNSNNIGKDNIIILASYKNQRDLNTFKRISQLRFVFFNTHDNKLGLPIEEKNVPFLFVTDNNLKTQSLFMPEKSMPELTELYFKTIITHYFTIDK